MPSDPRISVAFDGNALLDSGGVGTYARSLLSALARWHPENRYVILMNSLRRKISARNAVGPVSHSIRVVSGRFPNLFGPGHMLGPYRCYYPFLLRRHGLSVFHGLYSMPVRSSRSASVVTLHDISPVLRPDLFSRSEGKTRIKKIKEALKANMILVPSRYARDSIVRRFQVSPEQIKVVHHGVDNLFRPVPPDDVKEYLTKRYGITRRYVLNVGLYVRYKNKESLLRAFARLGSRVHSRWSLVLLGPLNRAYTSVKDLATRLGIERHVMFAGRVPLRDLPYFYSGADVFVFPSWIEGFGLPCLEAMACGTAVVASDTGAVPEVVGDAGILVDPADCDALSKVLQTILDNAELRENLGEQGLHRAEQFTWRRASQQVVNAYLEVAPK